MYNKEKMRRGYEGIILNENKAGFFLYVFKRNIPDLRLYEKFGFTVREDLGTRYIMERT